MSKKEQEFLNSRIEKTDEVIIAHYTKRRGAYIFNAFFGYECLKLIIFILLVIGLGALMYYLFNVNVFKEGIMVAIIFGLLISVPALCYIIFTFRSIVHYKYLRHVIVTNLGIYIAVYCYRKIRPQWSLYAWAELKSVTLKRVNQNKTYKLGDAIETGIAKITGTKSFYMARWDGEEKVDLLASNEVQEIAICFKEAKKSARRTKKKKGSKE